MENTRLLIPSSFLIIIIGFGVLWFGLKPVPVSPQSSPIAQASPAAIPVGSTPSAVVGGTMGERAVVTKVIDGDTIELDSGQKVRLVGIDTPETVDPRRPVGCFGKEASNATKSLLTGKMVILQKDVTNTDKYGRLLRYVYLPLDNEQILFINDYLVRVGFAKVYTYPPDVKFNTQFLEAQRQAQAANLGLWEKCQK